MKPQNSLSWATYNRQTWETGSEQREEPGPRAPGPGWQDHVFLSTSQGDRSVVSGGVRTRKVPFMGTVLYCISQCGQTQTDVHEYTHRYKATHRCTQIRIQTHICTQYTHRHSDTQGCTWANTDTHRCLWIHTEIHRHKMYTQRCTGTQMYSNTQPHHDSCRHRDTHRYIVTHKCTDVRRHMHTIPQYNGTCTHRHGHMYIHVFLCAH